MCLSFEWFQGADERLKKWRINGLSINEVQSSLDTYHSTIYPIAVEVANFISENWTEKQRQSLGEKYLSILQSIQNGDRSDF